MDWLILAVGAVVALAASAALVTALERLGARFGLPEATLGLMVALAADSPEVSSAVTAYVRGDASLGAGVVLGSNAFNLAAEDPALRDRYGRHRYGQSALLARRLVEAGAACVNINTGNWDHHNDIVKGLEQKRQRRKEKFYQKHCNRKNKAGDRPKPQPGRGAERMRELGLLMAGKPAGTQGQDPYMMSA